MPTPRGNAKTAAATKKPGQLKNAAIGFLLFGLGYFSFSFLSSGSKSVPPAAVTTAHSRAIELGDRDGRAAARKAREEKKSLSLLEITNAGSEAAQAQGLTGDERRDFMLSFTAGFAAEGN